MNDGRYEVLFLCTGNSARSILAEALLNHYGGGRFRAHSAGSHPTGTVQPLALALLARKGIAAPEARSKSWDEFSGDGAPELDFVFTVCGSAAGEACPVWRGGPATAHWGVDDPAAVEGSEAVRMTAFERACDALEHRIRRFVELPLETLDADRLHQRLAEIGRDEER